MVGLFNLFQSPSNRSAQAELPYSEFLKEVNNGQIKSVVIEGNKITGFISPVERRLTSLRRATRNSSNA